MNSKKLSCPQQMVKTDKRITLIWGITLRRARLNSLKNK